MSTISASTTTTTAYTVTADTTGTLVLQTGATPTTAVTVDASQNVGIGNTTIRNKLDIVGNTGVYSTGATSAGSPLGAQVYIGDSNYNTAGYYNAAPGFGAVYDATYASSAALAFYTFAGTANSRTERMRIDSSGNVLIGTTTAQTGAVLAVTGGIQGTIKSGTAVASTSGTSINFTSIPSWVKRVTVMFSGVSLNGASEPMIQIGTGGTPTTSGYAGRSAFAGASAGTVGYGAGFITFVDATAANTLYGQAILSLLNSSTNTWAYTAMFAASDVAYTTVGGGSVSLSGSLNMVRITTVNGTDAFDAGTINILYEG